MIRIRIDDTPDPPSRSWNETLRFSRKWMAVPALVLLVFLAIAGFVSGGEISYGRWLLFSVAIALVFYLLLLPAAGLTYQAWREFQHYGRPELGGRWVIAGLVALLLGLWLFRIAGGALLVWMEIPLFTFSSAAPPGADEKHSGEVVFPSEPWTGAVEVGVLEPGHPVYRFVLEQDDRGPANFAREWRLVLVPCGTACQQVLLFHRSSRNIIWGPTASAGVAYSENANLLVVNPPQHIEEAYGTEVPEWLETHTYQLHGGDRPRLVRLE